MHLVIRNKIVENAMPTLDSILRKESIVNLLREFNDSQYEMNYDEQNYSPIKEGDDLENKTK